MECSLCGAANPEGVTYCTSCGAVLRPAGLPGPGVSDDPLPPRPEPVTDLRTDPDIHLRIHDDGHGSGLVCPVCGKQFSHIELSRAGWDFSPRPARRYVTERKSAARRLFAALVILVLLAAAGAGGYAIRRAVIYNRALEAYIREDYRAAGDAFGKLGGYRESAYYLQECNRVIDITDRYYKAAALYEQEEYEKAYYLFLELSGFADSEARAAECVRIQPGTGVLSRGDSYVEGIAQLDYYGSLRKPSYLTVYLEDGTFWCSLWTAADTRLHILLAPGRYRVTWYMGTLWFGEKDRFGNDEETGIVRYSRQGDIIEVRENNTFNLD